MTTLENASNEKAKKIAVVIPCFHVAAHVEDVLSRIGPEVHSIVCVIDGCREGSEAAARRAAENDTRIQVIVHAHNGGVGHAVMAGYRQALRDGAAAIVKLDGDGQMAPEDIPLLLRPILNGEADYTKGNRFYHLHYLRGMPWLRLIGNAGLTFLSKLSSGYWNLFDPTNGFTAIHASVCKLLCEERVSARYFFESDVLFRLNTLRATVIDVPLPARYGQEKSHLNEFTALLRFPLNHAANFIKRLFTNYFLRDFNAASLHLIIGVLLMGFGVIFGSYHWLRGYKLDVLASPGTVMLAGLPVLLGWQSLLSFVMFDMAAIPRRPLQTLLPEPDSDSPTPGATDQ